MTTPRGIAGLTGSAKDQLLADVRASRRAVQERRPEPAPARPAAETGEKAFDFSTLPLFRQIRMQRAAADLIGIANPFFRAHDARAGATTEIDGRKFINFGSYDYLGLNGHPEVVAAAKAAIDLYGTSVSASRVVAGERPIHRQLEAALARATGVEDAVVFVSGHATNVNAIGTLMGPKDLVICDALIHNSVVEGVRHAGATRLMFPHNDLDALEGLLSQSRGRFERTLIVVEGVYSMDGDLPDLPRLVALKRRFGAWLMVDEAHALGVLGATGRGLAEHFGVDPTEVEIWMGTLSKTLCGCGGYIAGTSALCEFLKINAPGFVYSVGMPPPVAGAALACLEIMAREPERVARLVANGQYFLTRAKAAGLDTGSSTGHAVVPVVVGDSITAALLSSRLLEVGINAAPIIFPAVAEKSARLRFFITAAHTEAMLDEAIEATARLLTEIRADGPLIQRLAAGPRPAEG